MERLKTVRRDGGRRSYRKCVQALHLTVLILITFASEQPRSGLQHCIEPAISMLISWSLHVQRPVEGTKIWKIVPSFCFHQPLKKCVKPLRPGLSGRRSKFERLVRIALSALMACTPSFKTW